MSIASDQLAAAVRESAQEGAFAAPSELFAVSAAFEDPIKALADWDRANELFAAFDNDFGFINRSRNTKLSMQPTELSRYASLIRWLIRELRQWRPTADNSSAWLVAALVAAQVCDSENGLWILLPDDIGVNIELIDRLKGLVAAFTVEYTTPGGWPMPAREAEDLAKFKQADAQGEWAAIIEGWKMFEHQPFFTNTLQTQTVRLLYRYSTDVLAQAFANLRQTVIAMQVAAVLSVEQRLRLAHASANPYLQLASAYQTVSVRRHGQNLSSAEEQLLSELLLKVADDNPRWMAWMKIFNTYPIRFPLLQAPLGLALANAPDEAIEPYVQAIWLYAKQAKPDPGRKCVAECLRVFRAHASLQRRHALWTAAHNRWLDWNFGQADPNQHLFWISWCDLDFALVGYACECMDDAAREGTVAAIRNGLQSSDNRWHASFTDFVTEWNRLLSKLQPYAYALNVAHSNDDWLAEKQTSWPFDPTKDKYLTMKYRVS